MIKILKGSRSAVISHRFQQLIPILIWGFHIFSNSRTIMIRSKSTKWKWKAYYSNNQTIGHKKKRGCWFTNDDSYNANNSVVITLIQRMESWWWSGRSESEAGPRSRFGFGFFCFDSEIVILRVWGLGRRVERTAVEMSKTQ